MPQSSILDPIQPTLSPLVWDHPEAPEPTLKPVHAHFVTKHIYEVLERGGYAKPHDWLDLYLSGSLTTLQYSDDSDCDISLFIRLPAPEWSRAEMIGLMIEGTDDVLLPGTPYPLQAYVVSKQIKPADIYKPGLRSGYNIATHQWVVPPEPHRVHDVKAQEDGFYAWGMQVADKMERLLRYEPDKAVDFWHQIHRRRMRDQVAGKGDYSEANIIYKFLAKRNLMPQIAEVSGEHIAKGSGYVAPNADEHIPLEQAMAYKPIEGSTWDDVRKDFEFNHPDVMSNLRDDLAHKGMITPITIDRNTQEVTDGHHRLLAAQDIGMTHVPVTYGSPTSGGQWTWDPYTRRHQWEGDDWDEEHIGKTARAPLTAPITADEARGNSRPVTNEEFQQLAAQGKQHYDALAADMAPTTGLDQHWNALKQHAYESVQQPWGGATIHARTGQPLQSDADLYALSARPRDMGTVSAPIGASQDQFHQAMDTAKAQYQPLLERGNHYLGVFRDDDQGRIDFDPTVVVRSPQEVEALGAYTHAIGGAYHFATGNGYFPPHVADPATLAA